MVCNHVPSSLSEMCSRLTSLEDLQFSQHAVAALQTAFLSLWAGPFLVHDCLFHLVEVEFMGGRGFTLGVSGRPSETGHILGDIRWQHVFHIAYPRSGNWDRNERQRKLSSLYTVCFNSHQRDCLVSSHHLSAHHVGLQHSHSNIYKSILYIYTHTHIL